MTIGIMTENALKILEKRYLSRDENGIIIETVEGMFRRVAHTLSQAELYHYKDIKQNDMIKAIENDFYDMMMSLEFLPNSPTLMNAGKPLGQLSGCFVLPIEDDTYSIFDAIKYSAVVHKSGGGTGFNFSRLRPSGSIVKSTKGVASGPISFLKVFNAATECIKQGGVRRGANMGILRVDHPDIIEFIHCKENNNEINNFNLSVGITESFMKAVENHDEYELINPIDKSVAGKLKAREVFNQIVYGAWKNGEPGIIFLDRINKDNPTPHLGDIESTNPCGEQPLLPYESCNLGSINLSVMFNPNTGDIDYKKLDRVVTRAVRLLDNVITMNKFPLPEIEKTSLQTRKIGLGVMGWADLLIKLRIPYGSDESIELAETVMFRINEIAKSASWALADEKGAYPACRSFEDQIRNAARTTIAPTGTLSIIANCSSGIEPLFAIVMKRTQADMEMLDVNPLFIEMLEKDYSITLNEELLERILREGTIANIEAIPQEIKNIFITAHDVTPIQHIKMQAAFQKYTNNAVSKTINFKHNATQDDVWNAFFLAYKYGCKGVTLYRDGSREAQVLSTGTSYEKLALKDTNGVLQVIQPRQRPESINGFTEKIQIGCGKLYVTVNHDESGIAEVFTNTGRAGGCSSQSEATARLVSLGLRSGIDPKTIAAQLKGIRCPATIGKNLKCTSCPDAIGKIIEKAIQYSKVEYEEIEVTTLSDKHPIFIKNVPLCPKCKLPLEHDGGCTICRNCGFSKCG